MIFYTIGIDTQQLSKIIIKYQPSSEMCYDKIRNSNTKLQLNSITVILENSNIKILFKLKRLKHGSTGTNLYQVIQFVFAFLSHYKLPRYKSANSFCASQLSKKQTICAFLYLSPNKIIGMIKIKRIITTLQVLCTIQIEDRVCILSITFI